MKRLASVILTALVVVIISGVGGTPAVKAAEGKLWKAAETRINPQGGKYTLESSTGGQRTWETSPGNIRYTVSEPAHPQQTGGVYGIIPATPAWAITQEFTFTSLPDVLTPGEVFTISVTGRITITGSVEHADSNAKNASLTITVGEFGSLTPEGKYDLWQDGSIKKTMEIKYGDPPSTQQLSFTVPSDVTANKHIMLTVAGTPGLRLQGIVSRKYEGFEPVNHSLTLQHFHPFDYFKAGTGKNISPVGDILAVLKGDDGKPIPDELIIFYVDPETTSGSEPGHNLHKVVQTRTVPYALRGGPPGRIYLAWNHTDANGEARINYLGQIDTRAFANELVYQGLKFGQGVKSEDVPRISGSIMASVYNVITQTLGKPASVKVEYFGVAKLLGISGDGRPDDTETGRKYPGRVRVKRVDSGFIPREEGFIFMPWDIVDIDGNCAVEIAFINGDKVIARVPDEIRIGAVREPYKPPESQIILMGSAYDSGFPSTLEKVTGIGWGFGVKKGIEVVVETLLGSLVKEGAELVVEIYEGTKDIDLGDVDIVARTRIRSRVIVDNTGDGLKVYNIEGSPSVKTSSGREITLAEGSYVAVSETGVLGTAQAFDAKAVESEFYGRVPAIAASQTGVTGSGAGKSNFGLILAGAGAAVVILAVLGIMIFRRRTAAVNVYNGAVAPGGQPAGAEPAAFCPGCGKPNSRRTPFCGGCGRPLLQ